MLISHVTQTTHTCSYVGILLSIDTIKPPQNITINSVNQILSVMWTSAYNDTNSDSVMFSITCTNNMTALSAVVNDITLVQFNGIILQPDYQYSCCVSTLTVNGESETICDSTIIAASSKSSIMHEVISVIVTNNIVFIVNSNGMASPVTTSE